MSTENKKDGVTFTFDMSLPVDIDRKLREMGVRYGDRLIITKAE